MRDPKICRAETRIEPDGKPVMIRCQLRAGHDGPHAHRKGEGFEARELLWEDAPNHHGR